MSAVVSVVLPTLLLLSLLFLSSCFAAAETGFISLNYYKIKHLSKKGDPAATQVERWMRHPESLLSFMLIISNLLDISISSLSAVLGMHFYGQIGSAMAVGVVACCIIVFAEILPKTVAARFPEQAVFRTLVILGPIFWISRPLLKIFSGITRFFLKCFGFSENTPSARSAFLGKDELLNVIDDPGLPIPAHHKEMLKSILTLEEITVKTVMVTRHEMEGINLNQSLPQLLARIQQACHKYVVLYRETLDQPVGLLRVQTVQYMIFKKKPVDQKMIRGLIEPLYCIPEITPLSSQLLEFKSKNVDIGFVVDEYGDVQGLIALSDILEETIANLVTPNTFRKVSIRPQRDGSVIVSGTIPIRELNQKFGWLLPTAGSRTLNGLLLEYFSEIPEVSSTVNILHYTMTVLDVRKHRIKWVKIIEHQLLENSPSINAALSNTPIS